MAFDPYDPCPCGSGKKFKWCCFGVADEMDKVAGLQENHQTQATLQVLDRLEKTKPDTPWIYVTRAGVLLNEGRNDEARDALARLLELHPDHPFGQALFATASLAADGIDEAKPAIYKALRHCAGDFPDIVGSLALGLAGVFFGRQKYLACRQHLALAMRLLPDADKQEVFLRLLEFDGNDRIPYPLRSAHPVQPVPAAAEDEERSKLLRRAERSAVLGCFETAAHHYAQLAEQGPDSAALRVNLGLCHAWDGDEAAAADALHRAAALTEDFDTAVEYETLAQLLDQNDEDALAPITAVGYRVRSVGRLLTVLDEHDRFARVPTPPDEDDRRPSVVVSVLDRPLGEPDAGLSLDTVPSVLGRLVINESAPEDTPQVWLTGVEGESTAQARELFESVAADLVESTEPEDEAPLRALTPRELAPLQFQWHFPAGTPAVRQHELEAERWRKNVEETWPNLPQQALGGKSPGEAVGDDSLRVPVAASVYVLDSFCDRNGHILDVPATCERLGLPRPGVVEVTDELPLGSLSVMKLHRLPVERLGDDQLMYVLNRALLLRHNEFLDRVLREALGRPSCHEKIDLDRAYYTLSELARDRFERAEALEWIRKGTEHAAAGEEAFANTLRWQMRELSLRVEDPSDPQLMPHVRRVLDRYGKKIPRLAEHVQMVLAAYGVRAPQALEVAGVSGQVSESGLWTPGESEAGEAKKKRWLPGED